MSITNKQTNKRVDGVFIFATSSYLRSLILGDNNNKQTSINQSIQCFISIDGVNFSLTGNI